MKNFNQGRGDRFNGGFSKKEQFMHKAVCSNCGKTTEVPFKPTSGKPVYCKECFDKMGGASHASNDRPQRREFKSFGDKKFGDQKFSKFDKFGGKSSQFESRPQSRFEARAERFGLPNPDFQRKPELTDDLKRQMELVNTKLDKLISVAEKFFTKASDLELKSSSTQSEEKTNLGAAVKKPTTNKSKKSKKTK